MKLSEYRQIWCVDTEFVSQTGEHPSPVCFCAVEVRTGEQQVVWLEGGVPSPSPIPLGAGVLYVAYSARAELSLHLVLGWPLPVNVLDLHVEHLLRTNGQRWENCKLTTLCRQLGLPAPAEEHKAAMRDRILKGPPFTAQERKSILEYCLQDAQMLLEPTRRMFENRDLAQAVGARGEFMRVAAEAEHYGIPVDGEAYEALRRHMPAVWRRFVVELDHCGLYEDGHFHHNRLDQLVTKHDLPWPRTDKGNLHTDKDTWADMAELVPELVGPYAELRRINSWLREGLDLQVGCDGRSRPNTFPFAQKTGRTSPSGSSIFAQPKWLRGLLKPEPGTTLFYADYSQQEPGLAGFLSSDPGLRRCYVHPSGSFYVALMIECGAAPKEATKKTHPQVHKDGKVLLLAISYGAGPAFVAGRLGVSLWEGKAILHRLQKAFSVFFQWREEVLLKAQWQKYIESPDGWRQSIDSESNPRSVYNYPMQSTGAAMTRCAAILAAKAGLRVLVTVHDALLVEADLVDVDALNRLQEAMATGANLLAPDYGICHEVESVAYPDRYTPDDPPARQFWNKVMRVVAEEEGRDPDPWTIPE